MKNAPSPADTTPMLGTLLRMPYQAMMRDAMEPALIANGYGDIRIAHFPMLQALANHPEGMRATDLSVFARITKQSIGYLVDHLGACGYIERIADPADRRAKVIRLSAKGWEAGRLIRAVVRHVERDWATRIGSDRLEELRGILQDLIVSLARDPVPPLPTGSPDLES